jgi:tetratricopeptide (TPR) repeat protein
MLLVRVSLVALFVGGCRAPHRTCRDEIAAQHWAGALETCQADVLQNGDLDSRLSASTAAFYLGRFDDTVRLAAPLVTGSRAADAHALLGGARMRMNDPGAALSHLGAALALHTAANNSSAQARDAHQLAGVWFQLGAYQSALDALDVSYAAATRAGDQRMQMYFEIARADLLRGVGAHHAAEASIERALAMAIDPGDLVIARLKQGLVYLDGGHWALARTPLQRALDDELAGNRRADSLQSLYLNLAYVERRSGAVEMALRYLESSRQIAPDDVFSYRMNRGLVWRDMGKLQEAEAEMAAAEATGPRGEWSWWVPYNRAIVAELQGNLAAAAELHRVAIARVGELATQAGAWGPTLVASLRQPHLALVGMLARQERWGEVLELVAAMDGQALLDSKLAPVDRALEVVAAPSHSRARALESWSAEQLTTLWRGRRLVIIVPGGDRLWRLDVRDGEVRGEAIGDEHTAAELARQVETDPSDVEPAKQLAAMILPDEPTHQDRLDLLLVGPIARVPVATLRARRPIARVPGVLPRPRVERTSRGPSVAIGDPTGDLPASAREADQVAARLHGTAFVGAAATRSALSSARGGDVLHIAAHTAMRLDGAVLRLHDGDLTAAEIAALQPAARLVVLASCGAATGRDDAGNGSLAVAFLDAGAESVVAPKWSVGDDDAMRWITAFYAAGGDREPLHALEVARTTLAAELPAHVWAAFELLAARPTRP